MQQRPVAVLTGATAVRSAAVAAGAAVAALLARTPCRASPVLPESVQRAAMSCVGEAAEICPDVWTAQDHGLTCMTGQRARFSPRCRAVYDEVARALDRR